MIARLDNAGLRALLNSPSWREFESSLADGMRVSFSVCRGQERLLVAGQGCPWCQAVTDGAGECQGYLPHSLVLVGEPVMVSCQRGVPHAICHLAGEQVLDVVYLGPVTGAPTGPALDPTLPEISVAELREKARSVRTIIAGFVMAYFAATAWGRRGLEAAAIQEISRTIISLLHFGNPALDKALDLILNCLMILLDADACWLVTASGLTMMRGDTTLVRIRMNGSGRLPEGAMEQPIGQGGELGRLGVLHPADWKWAMEVLAQLANQVQIALEVDHLHRAAQRQVGMLLEAMDSAVLITDRMGRVSFANSAAEGLLERRAPDLFGQDADALLPPLAGAVVHTLSTGRRHQGLGQSIDIAGRSLYVDWHTAPLLDAGETAGCLLLLRDQTEAYSLRRQLLEGQRLHVAGQIAALVAPKIESPLGAVRDILQQLAHGGTVPAREDLGRALIALNQVEADVGDFLQLAQAGRQTRATVDLARLVREVAWLVAPQAAQQGVSLEVQAADPGPAVWGNGAEWHQVLLSLCRNALEAMPGGGRLTLAARGEGRWALLRVSDTGEGLAAVDTAPVSEPFMAKQGGPILGLSLCQAIAQAHGGRLEVSRRDGQGTEVVACLPLYNEPARVQMLVVTPDAVTRTLVETAVGHGGLSALSLGEGGVVAEIVRRCRPQIAVVDLRLGPQWREAVHGVWQAKVGTAVILLTDPGSEVALAEARTLGITSHLEHPVDPAALAALVQRLLSGSA